MSQTNQVVANQTMANARIDINSHYAALFSISSGASAPTTTNAYLLWADTANGVIKQRNAADSAWITVFTVGKQGLIPQDGSTIYAADAGSSDAYAITLSPAPTAYTKGMIVNFEANTLNTGACTLNLNSIGAVTIKKNVTDDLVTGDILANQMVSVIYDGTNFQVVSALSGGLLSSDIGVTVQGYDADTVKSDVATTFTLAQHFGEASVSDGATITWNPSTAQTGSVTLGGNRTLALSTASGAYSAGATYALRVIQDGTGSRTLSYTTQFHWAGGTSPTLSLATGAVDLLTFYCDGSNLLGASLLDYST